jgi:hypothetical protein
MSTRCQIGVYAKTTDKLDKPFVLLYRHCDGYPDGAGEVIKQFLPKFLADRGYDVEYLSARLLVALMRSHDALKDGDNLGYGICGDKILHWDIEYYYAVYPNWLKIYSVPSLAVSEKRAGWTHLKLMKAIRIAEDKKV